VLIASQIDMTITLECSQTTTLYLHNQMPTSTGSTLYQHDQPLFPFSVHQLTTRASIRSDKAVTDTWYCDQSEGHIRVCKQEAHYATTHLAC